MSVNGISNSGIGVNPYACTNSNRKTAETGNFAGVVQKAEEDKRTAGKTGSSAREGDMVVLQPPNYSGFTYDSSISNKSKEEMTMDEYKQWGVWRRPDPCSGWVRRRATGSGGW